MRPALVPGACGTISRDHEAGFRRSYAGVALPADAQVLARQAPQDLALAERVQARPPAESHAILALSGGGANGAYGVGVIVGRTSRPRCFSVSCTTPCTVEESQPMVGSRTPTTPWFRFAC